MLFCCNIRLGDHRPNTKYHVSLLNSLTYHTIKNYDRLVKMAVIHMLSVTSMPSSKGANQGISAFGKSRIGKKKLLSERPRSKHFGNEVEGLAININPGDMELDDRVMIKGAEEVNL